jgi:predicted secreted acid phosphatase
LDDEKVFANSSDKNLECKFSLPILAKNKKMVYLDLDETLINTFMGDKKEGVTP